MISAASIVRRSLSGLPARSRQRSTAGQERRGDRRRRRRVGLDPDPHARRVAPPVGRPPRARPEEVDRPGQHEVQQAQQRELPRRRLQSIDRPRCPVPSATPRRSSATPIDPERDQRRPCLERRTRVRRRAPEHSLQVADPGVLEQARPTARAPSGRRPPRRVLSRVGARTAPAGRAAPRGWSSPRGFRPRHGTARPDKEEHRRAVARRVPRLRAPSSNWSSRSVAPVSAMQPGHRHDPGGQLRTRRRRRSARRRSAPTRGRPGAPRRSRRRATARRSR